MLAQNPNTTPAQPSQFDFLSKLLLVIVSRSNRFYRKRTPLVKMTLSHKAQCILLNLNLNLNSLLVKRQIDNPSPGAVTGGN